MKNQTYKQTKLSQIQTIIVSLIIIIFFYSCKEKITLSDNPSYHELKQFVKARQDHRATFTFDQYEKLLKELSKDRYITLPINDFRKNRDSSKVLVGLRHDIDCHPFKAWKMAQMERNHGINASYYILATADYYGKIRSEGTIRFKPMEQVYQNIHLLGNEVGIHNDLITIMIKYGLDPLKFTQQEVNFYDGLNISIHGSVAHGSPIAQKTKPNFWIFSNFAETNYIEYKGKKHRIGRYSMKEYGFKYEANFLNFNKYFSESSGEWNVEGGLEEVLNQLRKSQKGKRIQILAHPVWWGK